MSSTPTSPRFAAFSELSEYLEALGLFRMTPGLERMRAVLGRLGLTRPPCTVVQVAGTNGKGSVSTMLAALARGHGLRVGLHISPHFCSVRERVRLNGAMLPEESWTALGNTLMRHGAEELTYFEFVTAIAVLAFAEAGVELAVMETGLGGSFDATTALEADLLVYTPIDQDHELVLGPSIRDIAAEKAGAMRPGRPAISAGQLPEAMAELERVAHERGCALYVADSAAFLPEGAEKDLCLGLPGRHQRENARLALSAWRLLARERLVGGAAAAALGRSYNELVQEEGLPPAARGASAPLDPAIVGGLAAGSGRQKGRGQSGKALKREDGVSEREGRSLRAAWLPGRMQFVAPRFPGQGPFARVSLGQPQLLLDGAHNRHGLAALGLALAGAGIAPGAVLFACLADKDLDLVLPQVRALATGPIIVPPISGNPRAMPTEELARMIGLNAEPAASLPAALERAAKLMAERLPEAFSEAAPRHPLLLCGSLYLLGEFYALMPEYLERSEEAERGGREPG